MLRLGSEAVLDLDRWSPARPACRGLRRKLRAAEGAGVAVALAPAPPWAGLRAVQDAWTAAHGRERGFSMGRFDPGLLETQRVVVARHGGRVVAFASFHATAEEWTLDLLRHGPAPDGAVHALLAHAARLARGAGARRLSLAGVPRAPLDVARHALGLPRRGSPGLERFKRSFGPRLAPRFAAAPSAAGLAAGLLAVAWAICRPPPLPPAPAPQNEFEPDGASCDAPPRRA